MKFMRTGKKVIIRPYEKQDYEAWKFAFLNIRENSGNIFEVSKRRESKELILPKYNALLKTHATNRKNDYFYSFGVFLKDGTLVGHVSLMDISREIFQNAYIGYAIFNPYWGKGYGSEAVRLLIDIAFKDLNLHRVEAGIELDNKASISTAKSAGLKRENVSRKRLFIREKWRDLALYTATCEDYGINWKKRDGTQKK